MVDNRKGIVMSYGGGISSDELTATAEDIRAGKTYVGKDTGDEAGNGGMANAGGAIWTASGERGETMIDKGYRPGTQKIVHRVDTFAVGQNLTPGMSDQTVSCKDKYCNGNVTVIGDNNLIAANIRKGVTIFGVTGTWEGY